MREKSQIIPLNGDKTKNNDSPSVYNYLDYWTLEPVPITNEITLYIVSVGSEYRISAVDNRTRQHFESEPTSYAKEIYIIRDHRDFFATLETLGKIERVFPMDEEYHTNLLTNRTFTFKEIQTYYKGFTGELRDKFGLAKASTVVQTAPLSIESTSDLIRVPATLRFFESPNSVDNPQFHPWNEERSSLFYVCCCFIPLSRCRQLIEIMIHRDIFSPQINSDNTLATLDILDEETQSPMQR